MKNLVIALSLGMSFLSAAHANQAKQPTLTNQSTELILPKVGLQLWSIRDLLSKDFDGTLQQVAKLGFQGVEFARDYGPFDKTQGKALKQYLANLGLGVAGAHVEFNEFDDANFQKSVQFYQDLGAPYLIVSWDKRAWDPLKIDEFIQQLNTVSNKVAEHGLKLGFHNHDLEFSRYKQATYWDYIHQHTPDSMPLQLDIGMVAMSGQNPAEYINKYPTNTRTVHYRPYQDLTKNKTLVFGQDDVNWPAVIAANVSAQTDWLVLEQTDYLPGMTSLETIAESKKGLDVLLKYHLK
ncbi:sugar phosphate isomerase/epimerase [Catenovulum sp. SM1970]|uniref:sugar phosphate isomerase/epimerase family protein n=1 Tax=Marinifaba aquimaris TaxID=2741323 RepID=UPI00157204CB|nr:sugar phosphate isomerase/epimerase [Marinifaba aquimaris]NTS76630.1 sugar phosphate isomerase/epimerase [Marinifaba aquimaris]